ncbi:hypothetical protein HPP92_018146 [Vanilla planifolia]|nr:hypothetical protein HPP92_018146 [Vanilla planifolia]
MSEAGDGARRRPEPPAAGDTRRERCPRCGSRDTKFCYYNNYNTAQPRHFCKSCHRYWTLGGSLRNVPVGGSSRKRHRPNPNPNRVASAMPPPPPAAAAAPLQLEDSDPSGFGSILAGSVFPVESILDGRAGFDLGLGLGIGSGTVLWPPSLLEEVVGDTWRLDGGSGECFGAAVGGAESWKDMGITSQVDGGGETVGAKDGKFR